MSSLHSRYSVQSFREWILGKRNWTRQIRGSVYWSTCLFNNIVQNGRRLYSKMRAWALQMELPPELGLHRNLTSCEALSFTGTRLPVDAEFDLSYTSFMYCVCPSCTTPRSLLNITNCSPFRNGGVLQTFNQSFCIL